MSLPNQIESFRNSIIQTNEDIDQEDDSAIRFSGKLQHEESFSQISNLKTILYETGYGDLVIETEFGQNIKVEECDPADLCTYSFTVYINKKSVSEGHYWMHSAKCLRYCRNSFWLNARHVEVAGDFEPFASYLTHFTPFDSTPNNEIPQWNGELDARSIVRVRSDRVDLPRDIRPWVLSSYSKPSLVLSIWRDISARKLMYIWCDEITDDLEDVFCVFTSNRRKVVPVGRTPKDGVDGWYKAFEDAVVWVFGSRTEAPTRHALLTHYLSIEFPAQSTWVEVIDETLARALDNAKSAYRLQAVETSKEFINNVTTLRKVLSDEVQVFNKITRDISNTLWKDFATAAGLVFLRFFLRGKGVLDDWALDGLLIAAAAFLAISYLINLYNNTKFMRVYTRNKHVWRRRIFNYLSDDEYNMIYDQPLREAVSALKRVSFVVGVIYFLGVTALLALAFPYHASEFWRMLECGFVFCASSHGPTPAP